MKIGRRLRTLLAKANLMRDIIPISVGAAGAAAAGLLYREHSIRAKAERLSAATLETLLNAIDANDADTGAHVRRVATYSLILGKAAGLGDRALHAVERTALFHDIGKLHGALTDIFHDPSKLTPEERRAVTTHPQRGADVLAPLSAFFPDLPKGVAAHHECWDGTGYPRRLKGRKIPLEARVVAIADTFDAITYRRRYSHARSLDEAVSAIAKGAGTQFDPDLVDLFLSQPVIAEVETAMRETNRPKKKSENRRRGEKKPTPDVTFRWRPRLLASRPRDHRR
jgi:HD-GYP domain-containing protein (c-di-GMP phosphodiesterase class II)